MCYYVHFYKGDNQITIQQNLLSPAKLASIKSSYLLALQLQHKYLRYS